MVGTRRIRRVDDDWPAEGSKFHHSVGTGAAELHDSSKIVERHRPEHMVLEVRFRPTGIPRVTLDVHTAANGSEIVLEEVPQRGPFALVPRIVTDPLTCGTRTLSSACGTTSSAEPVAPTPSCRSASELRDTCSRR